MPHELPGFIPGPLCRWCLPEVGGRLDEVLPGVESRGIGVLWLSPPGGQLTTAQLDGLAESVKPLRFVAWFPPQSFGGRGSKVQAPARFSGRFSVQIDNLGIDFEGYVRWVNPKEHDRVCELLNDYPRQPAGWFKIALAAIQYDSIVAARFCKAVQGPAWLWVAPEWIANARVPSLDSNSVVASYVKLIDDLGGLTILSWNDGRERNGVAVFGATEMLNRIAEHVAGLDGFLNDDEAFERSIVVGVGFSMGS